MLKLFPDSLKPYLQLTVDEFKGLPNGVKEIKMNKRYEAYYIDHSGRDRKIGYFKTVTEAHRAWQEVFILEGLKAMEEYAQHEAFNEDLANAVLGKVETVIQDYDAGIVTGIQLDG